MNKIGLLLFGIAFLFMGLLTIWHKKYGPEEGGNFKFFNTFGGPLFRGRPAIFIGSFWIIVGVALLSFYVFLVSKGQSDLMASSSGPMKSAYAYARPRDNESIPLLIVASADARSTCDKLYHPYWTFLIRIDPNNLSQSQNFEVGGSSDPVEASWIPTKEGDHIFGAGTLSLEKKGQSISGAFDLTTGRPGKNYGLVQGSFEATRCE